MRRQHNCCPKTVHTTIEPSKTHRRASFAGRLDWTTQASSEGSPLFG